MAKIHKAAMILLLPISIAFAQQTITLNDGTQFRGRFVSGSENLITFVDQNGERHRFNVNEVRTLTFSGGDAYSSGNSNNSGTPRDDRARYNRSDDNSASNRNNNNNNNSNSGNNYERSNNSNRGAYATLPANTEVSVRSNETVNAREAQPGRTYAASIDRDVTGQNGNVVIPRGSEALLEVRDAGNGQILLDLNSVNVNGQRYYLSTQDVVQNSKSDRGLGTNRRTGTYVGGGAALGTLLGAIGGGGKGALIGALAGAAAGAGVQVLTKGSEVRVPAETVLNFRLDQPIYLYQ